MYADDALILGYPELDGRLGKLYTRLSESESFRAIFIKDPVGIIGDFVFPGFEVKSGEINQGNRLLFSLLSNPGFIRWAKGFEERLLAQVQETTDDAERAEAIRMVAATVDRTEIYREIVEGIQQHGDLEAFYSLLVRDRSGQARVLGSALSDVEPILARESEAGIAVAVETFFCLIDIVFVFLIISQVDLNPVVSFAVSRADLQRISRMIGDQMTQRAEEMRSSGTLTSPTVSTQDRLP